MEEVLVDEVQIPNTGGRTLPQQQQQHKQQQPNLSLSDPTAASDSTLQGVVEYHLPTTTTTTMQQEQPLLQSNQPHQHHLRPKSLIMRQQQEQQPKKEKKRWTDTNSDKHCIQNTQNPFAQLGYTISLATGFYAIEPLDKQLSVILAYALLVIFLVLIHVFYQGVQDGLAAATAAAVQEVATVLVANNATGIESEAEIATGMMTTAAAAAEENSVMATQFEL